MLSKYLGQSQFTFQVIVFTAISCLIWALFQDYSWHWWLISYGVYFIYGCLGITVTFHRYLTHRSFKLNKWKERALAVIGHLAGTGSAITWVSIHMAHHVYTDTDKDPHSPVNGLLGMLTLQYKVPKFVRYKLVLAMAKDPFYKMLHDYYLGLHLIYSLCIYMLFGVDGLLFGHIIPVAITALVSAVSNYFSHYFGYQTYKTQDKSKNDPILAFLAWGEGWHNNHHKHPGRAKFGEKWWEFDISWYVIRLIRNG